MHRFLSACLTSASWLVTKAQCQILANITAICIRLGTLCWILISLIHTSKCWVASSSQSGHEACPLFLAWDTVWDYRKQERHAGLKREGDLFHFLMHRKGKHKHGEGAIDDHVQSGLNQTESSLFSWASSHRQETVTHRRMWVAHTRKHTQSICMLNNAPAQPI